MGKVRSRLVPDIWLLDLVVSYVSGLQLTCTGTESSIIQRTDFCIWWLYLTLLEFVRPTKNLESRDSPIRWLLLSEGQDITRNRKLKMNQGLIKVYSCNEARNSKRIKIYIYNAIIMIIQVHENFSYDQIYIRIKHFLCY